MNIVSPASSRDDHKIALVVDLDGALLQTQVIYEVFFESLSHLDLQTAVLSLRQMLSGAHLSSKLSSVSSIDHRSLPVRDEVFRLIVEARANGRRVYLAMSGSRSFAEPLAESLGLFDGVLAPDGTTGDATSGIADVLIASFGQGGFDYVCNGRDDRDVWHSARRVFGVDVSESVARELEIKHPQSVIISQRKRQWPALLRAMRPHQYAKNALIFVPLLTAHQFNLTALSQACLAFVAFSLCASSVYLLNDLLDIKADRAHPTKRRRPFASGALSIPLGMACVPALLLAAFALAWFIAPQFFLTLGIYFAATNAYSLVIKKRMIVDVVTLACLYTLRVFAGAAAIDVAVSDWLFTFSLLIFTALALLKRYIELSGRLDMQLSDPDHRDYRIADLPVIIALAAAAGMNSVMVIALYVSSDAVVSLYSHPKILWGLCPLFLYWIARAIMLTHRRRMDEDPIAFALKDSRSWAVGAISIALVFGAI